MPNAGKASTQGRKDKASRKLSVHASDTRHKPPKASRPVTIGRSSVSRGRILQDPAISSRDAIATISGMPR